MKKLIIISLAILFLVIPAQAGIHPITTHLYALAATATESATPSTEVASPSQDIQEKIKNLVKENLSATETDLKEKINQQTLVGYVGNIKSINTDSLTLSTVEDTLIQVTTQENTTFLKSNSVIKSSSLAISDKVIIIGTLLKEDIVLAKRIVVVVGDPDEITSGTVVAKISAVDIKKKTVTLLTDNTEIIYLLTKKSTIDLTELEEGQSIFAITKKYEGKDYLAVAKVI